MPPPVPTEISLLSTTSSLGSNSAPKAVSPEQREIELIWRQLHEKVVQLASSDPEFQLEKTLDINGVLHKVDLIQQKEQKKAEKYGPFKSILNKTLQCINTIGGMVSEGVSEVFGPTQMCYNALTFVIQAWLSYDSVLPSLGDLLDRCTAFLERLSYYQNPDMRLARLICLNLRLFVQVCDRLIQMKRKSHRMKVFANILFLNDSGISDLVDSMDKLRDKETPMVNAQIFQSVMESAKKLDRIDSALDGQREQKKEEDWSKRRKAIAKALGFHRNAIGTDGEPIPHWQRVFNTRKGLLVDKTGDWIADFASFVNWKEDLRPQRSVLLLEGEGGTGKTSMMANVLKTVRNDNDAASGPRLVTAYYFPEADKRKADDEDASTFVETVTRTLLWQVFTAHEALTKSVAQIIDKTPEFDSPLDMWDKMLLRNKEFTDNTRFLLFIDGVDEYIEDLVKMLEKLTIWSNGKIRFFLTGRPETTTFRLKQSGKIPFDAIPIANHNEEDISKYINSRLDSIQITSSPNRHPEIFKWRTRIFDDLRQKCNGDYLMLNNTLDRLSNVDLVEDVERILDDAGKTRTDQIDAEITRLNRERTLREIQEINEIILWLEAGREFYSLELLESLLSIKHRYKPSSLDAGTIVTLPKPHVDTSTFRMPMTRSAAPFEIELAAEAASQEDVISASGQTISLLPFAQKLRQKYPIFTVTDSGLVDWRSTDVKRRIPSRALDISGLTRSASMLTSHVIHDTEIEIVQHFLSQVCPSHLYDRFEFDHFFEAKRGARQKEMICIDQDNADIKIAIGCLSVLTDNELSKDARLRLYAGWWLLEHLTAVDLSLADRDLKGKVGQLLVQLFRTNCGIDALFWCFDVNVSMRTWINGEQRNLCEARSEWLYSMEGVKEVQRWFRDSAVTRPIQSEPGLSFVKDVNKAMPSQLHQAVLAHAAVRMADHLFRQIEFTHRQFLSASCFLRGYLARLEEMSGETSPENKMPDEASQYNAPEQPGYEIFEQDAFACEEISTIELWSAQALDNASDNKIMQSLWEIHGALIVFQLCGGSAETYLGRVRPGPGSKPEELARLSLCLEAEIDPGPEAIKLLRTAKRELDELRRRDHGWLTDSANSSLLARITIDLGTRLWEAGDDDKAAAEMHRESLEYNYVHFKDYAAVLEMYSGRKAWTECIHFMQAINEHSETWAAYLDELVNEFIIDFQEKAVQGDILAQAADATGEWKVIEDFYAICTDFGVKQGSDDLTFIIRDAFASTLDSSTTNRQQDKVIDIREHALHDIKSKPNDTLSREYVDAMTASLAETYLALAGHSVDTADSFGHKLAALVPDPEDLYAIWMGIVPTCCLLRLNHKHKTHSKLAQRCADRLVKTSLDLLSDEDEDNDDQAFFLLSRVFTVREDERNSAIAWTLRSFYQHREQQRWEEWKEATHATSPTETTTVDASRGRAARSSPNLPQAAIMSSTPPLGAPTRRRRAKSNATTQSSDRSASPMAAFHGDRASGTTTQESYENISIVPASATTPTTYSSTIPMLRSSAQPPDFAVAEVRPSSASPRGASPSSPVVEEKMPRPGTEGFNSLGIMPISSPVPQIAPMLRSSAVPQPPSAADGTSRSSSRGISPSYNNGRMNGSENDDGTTTPATPQKPDYLVECDGCGKRWTTMEVPLFICADCPDAHFDKECEAKLASDAPLQRRVKCSKEHRRFLLPAFDGSRYAGMPKGCVPLPPLPSSSSNDSDAAAATVADDAADPRWCTMEEWKADVRESYLDNKRNSMNSVNQAQVALGLGIS